MYTGLNWNALVAEPHVVSFVGIRRSLVIGPRTPVSLAPLRTMALIRLPAKRAANAQQCMLTDGSVLSARASS